MPKKKTKKVEKISGGYRSLAPWTEQQGGDARISARTAYDELRKKQTADYVASNQYLNKTVAVADGNYNWNLGLSTAAKDFKVEILCTLLGSGEGEV